MSRPGLWRAPGSWHFAPISDLHLFDTLVEKISDKLSVCSGLFKRALAQTCLLAWYQVPILGHYCGLVHGEGGAPVTVPLHHLRVTSHVLHHLRVTSHVLHQDAPLGSHQARSFEIIFGLS